MKKLRAAAVTYHRVSTVDQDPTLARRELRAAARARELPVIDEIEETGSGALTNRPGLERALAHVRAGAASHVLCWKLDRFGRSTLDLLHQVEEISRAGGTFVATSQGLEIGRHSGPMGKLILQVMAAIAEFERTLLKERTLLGMEAARARGIHVGRPAGSRDSKPRRRRWGKA